MSTETPGDNPRQAETSPDMSGPGSAPEKPRKPFRWKRWLLAAILLLSLMANVFFLIGFMHARERAAFAAMSFDERKACIAEYLGIDVDRLGQLHRIQKEEWRGRRKIGRGNRELRQEVLDQVFSADPDQDRLRQIMQGLSAQHAEVTMNTTASLIAFIQDLEPDQREKLRTAMARKPGLLLGFDAGPPRHMPCGGNNRRHNRKHQPDY